MILGSERSAGLVAVPEGQEVRLAVLAMVGTTVFDGGLMERAMSRTLVEQGSRKAPLNLSACRLRARPFRNLPDDRLQRIVQ